MPDSIDKKLKEKHDNLDDDLDAMLDEAESSLLPMNEFQDDDDTLDRLLMNAGFDSDDALMQSEAKEDVSLHDELDDLLGFDDFGDDFNEPKKTQAVVELEQTVDDSSLVSSSEHQDDEDALDRLLMNAGFDADDAPMQATGHDDINAVEELDDFSDFSDFSDFNEPDMVRQDSPRAVATEDVAETELAAGSLSALADDINESDVIHEVEASAPALAEIEEPDVEDDVGTDKELDVFSDFSDFTEPDILPIVEIDEPEQVIESLSAHVDDVGLSDEIDDFFSLSDDFDESDMIQDDEADVPVQAETDLIGANQEQQTVDEQSSDDEDAVGLSDEIDDFSGFSADFDESDMIQDDEADVPVQAETDLIGSNQESPIVVEQPSDDEALDEVDEFSGFGDDFDISDMIQDDGAAASVPVEADLISSNQEQRAVVEESFNDLLNDESGLDSLLMDSGFDAEDVLEQTAGKKDAFGDDADLSEIDDFFQLDEVSDDFSNETEADQLAETEQSIQDEDDFLLPDFDITADMEISDMGGSSGIKEDDLADAFGDTDFLNEDETVQALNAGADEAIVESQPKQAADAAIEDPENVKMSPFAFEQEDVKKKLEDAENKVKKAKLFGYAALGFGAVALSAAAGLGVMTYGAKAEVSKLTEQVSTLEANLAKTAENNPNEEINAVMSSVVQLNHQVYGFITELKGNPQIPVDLLNNNVSDIVAKQGMVSKALDMLQVKMGAEGKMPLESLVTEPHKAEAVHEPAPAKEGKIAPVKTGTAPEQAPTKPTKEEVAHEHVSIKEEAAHEIAPTKERAKHEVAPAKVEAVPETAPAKVKAQPEAVPATPITPPKAVVKEEPVKPSKQTTAAAAKWGVNLVAFKQEWFAKSKAAEFARLGVFAEVIPVHEKNATMYRLRVGGFKSKADAFSNTDRIKKTLNLDSVWVSDN
ncbi:SPOR domain-containing protein [Methylobacter tundripaludum]|uniref:SPOR domain-containing protein n=1 Tax=Methylobacter tundripaludum TaxID=173365 RepID=UPI0004DF75EB|nr:SPOR domain-containing protein [Methylobacter tundripaludum]